MFHIQMIGNLLLRDFNGGDMTRTELIKWLDDVKVRAEDNIRFHSTSGLEWHIDKVDLTEDKDKKRKVIVRLK